MVFDPYLGHIWVQKGTLLRAEIVGKPNLNLARRGPKRGPKMDPKRDPKMALFGRFGTPKSPFWPFPELGQE